MPRLHAQPHVQYTSLRPPCGEGPTLNIFHPGLTGRQHPLLAAQRGTVRKEKVWEEECVTESIRRWQSIFEEGWQCLWLTRPRGFALWTSTATDDKPNSRGQPGDCGSRFRTGPFQLAGWTRPGCAIHWRLLDKHTGLTGSTGSHNLEKNLHFQNTRTL